MKQKLTEFKREIENFIITVGFNISQGKFQIYVKFWKKKKLLCDKDRITKLENEWH